MNETEMILINSIISIISLISLFFGFKIIIPALKRKLTRKQVLDGIADEDGWEDGETGVNIRRAAIGLGLIIFSVACITIVVTGALRPQHTPHSVFYAKSSCNEICSMTSVFRTVKGHLPVAPEDLQGRLDTSILAATHTPDQLPKGQYRNFYFCYLHKRDPASNEIVNIAVFCYPVKYSESYRFVYYRVMDSSLSDIYGRPAGTFSAEIRDLHPTLALGSPVPYFKQFVDEDKLPAAFKFIADTKQY